MQYPHFDQFSLYPSTNIAPRRFSSKDKLEGFWYSKIEPYYPMPVRTDTPVDPVFLNTLKQIMSKHAKVHQSKGSSPCRLCIKKNGSQEYQYGPWHFPSGLIHYYEDHNVQPSPAFRNFIMEQVLPT